MRSLTTVCCVSWLVFAGALAVACGDDDAGGARGAGGDGNSAGSSEPGDGGTPGSGASSNMGGKSGSGGNAGSGEGGDTSMGGTTGEGGEPGNPGGTSNGEGGAGGIGGDPVDPNLCESFPITVTAGPSIGLDVTGALICLDPCRITTNTYSDGEGACAESSIGFWVNGSQDPYYDVRLPQDWAWESASAGTINTSDLQNVPEATEVTAVVSDEDENEYTLVFTFPGNGEVTVTSFTAN